MYQKTHEEQNMINWLKIGCIQVDTGGYTCKIGKDLDMQLPEREKKKVRDKKNKKI